jgi:hypothetical protein
MLQALCFSSSGVPATPSHYLRDDIAASQSETRGGYRSAVISPSSRFLPMGSLPQMASCSATCWECQQTESNIFIDLAERVAEVEGAGILLLAPWEEYLLRSINDLPITEATQPLLDLEKGM